VRLELQPISLQVYGPIMLTDVQLPEEGDIEEALNAASSIGDDVLQKKYQGRVIPDAFTHGTAAQRSSWLRKGWVRAT
jgi:predicted metalloprotease